MTEVVFPLWLEAPDLEIESFEPTFVRHDLWLAGCVLCQEGLCTQQILPPGIIGEGTVIVHGRVPDEWGN